MTEEQTGPALPEVMIIEPGVTLIVDPDTGLAIVNDEVEEQMYGAHPTALVSAGGKEMMVKGDWWGSDDVCIVVGEYVYNTTRVVGIWHEYQELARQHCKCGGWHNERESKIWLDRDDRKSWEKAKDKK
jgi:hypothetical protein